MVNNGKTIFIKLCTLVDNRDKFQLPFLPPGVSVFLQSLSLSFSKLPNYASPALNATHTADIQIVLSFKNVTKSNN